MLLPRLKNDSIEELTLTDLQKEQVSAIREKLNQNVYSEEQIVCPVCSSEDAEVVGEKDRYGLRYQTNICKGCGLVYTNPRMNQGSYNEFYNSEYRNLYKNKVATKSGFFEQQLRKGRIIFTYLKQHNLIGDGKMNVLEIGCGAGGILEFFKQKGHQVRGYDLGTEYINYGKSTHQLELFEGTLTDVDSTFKPDLIIYSHVLEHILDLNTEVELLKKISSEHTLLYIEVPGIKNIRNSYQANVLRYFQNAHVFHFSLESLTNLMTNFGFIRLCGDQYIRSCFRLGERHGERVNDFQSVRRFLRSTERLRQLYRFNVASLRKSLFLLKLKFRSLIS